ncbi:MAG: hypothetical protein AAB630_00465 [Patescibacteria group bacterium]
MKLDLGCGQNKQQGFKGVDIAPGPGVDYVIDLERYPWKEFEDGSIEEIYASHYVEHVSDLIKFMNEVWRIAEDGAKVTFVAPYYTSIRAWQDPTHKQAISEATWLYYNKAWREANKLAHYPITCNFDIIQMVAFFNSPWDKKTEEARQFAQQHYFNAVSDILIELKAIK